MRPITEHNGLRGYMLDEPHEARRLGRTQRLLDWWHVRFDPQLSGADPDGSLSTPRRLDSQELRGRPASQARSLHA